MEGFLAADDKRSTQQRKRLLVTLEKLTATLEGDALALQGIEAKGNRETKVAFAMFVLRSTGHSLLPWGMPITRFLDVMPDYLEPVPKRHFSRATHVARRGIASIYRIKLFLGTLLRF